MTKYLVAASSLSPVAKRYAQLVRVWSSFVGVFSEGFEKEADTGTETITSPSNTEVALRCAS
eukprot:8800308-Pyramimonas_sp.AAC.1